MDEYASCQPEERSKWEGELLHWIAEVQSVSYDLGVKYKKQFEEIKMEKTEEDKRRERENEARLYRGGFYGN